MKVRRAGALIIRDGKILLIHRKKKGDEYWVLVGGGVEIGETVEQALVREVREETGLEVKTFDLLRVHEDEKVIHSLFCCSVEGGEPILGGPEKEEMSDSNWYNLEWIDGSS